MALIGVCVCMWGGSECFGGAARRQVVRVLLKRAFRWLFVGDLCKTEWWERRAGRLENQCSTTFNGLHLTHFGQREGLSATHGGICACVCVCLQARIWQRALSHRWLKQHRAFNTSADPSGWCFFFHLCTLSISLLLAACQWVNT